MQDGNLYADEGKPQYEREVNIMDREFTRTEVYRRYGKGNVIIIPSNLILTAFERAGFWTGTYGWDCDIYYGRQYAYTFGYRPFGTKWEGDMQSLFNTMLEDGVEVNEYSRCYKEFMEHRK